MTNETAASTEPLKELSVGCPRGYHVIGGGAGVLSAGTQTFETPANVVLSASVPVREVQWLGRVLDTRPEIAVDWSLRVQALCSTWPVTRFSSDDFYVTEFDPVFASDVWNVLCCPTGQVRVGGGAEITGTLVNTALTISKSNLDDSWEVMAHEVGNGNSPEWACTPR